MKCEFCGKEMLKYGLYEYECKECNAYYHLFPADNKLTISLTLGGPHLTKN